MTVVFEIAVIAFLVVLNGCFAMSELAIVSSRKSRLAAMAADGNKGAKVALELAANPGRFLSSVQIGITLVGILAGAYSGATLAEHLSGWFDQFPLLDNFNEALSIALVVGAITYASLIVGELVPKHIALSNPERVAALVSRPMALIATLAHPLVWLLELSSQAALKLLRIRKSDSQTVTEEEVRAMIAEGTESGVFEPQEKELISGVMRFGDRKIRAIMTPRNDLISLNLDWDSDRIMQTLRDCPHSRLTVHRNDPNEVLGVVQAKDLLNDFLAGKPFDLAASVKPVEVVHDNAPALHVLDILKRSPIHLAVVVDEYGSLEGIVTASDILSSIVGSLYEHGEEYEGVIVEREDGSWLLDGDAAVDLIRDKTGCRIMDRPNQGFSTIAGFILSRSRRIPKTGDHFTWEGWRFEVVDMDGLRIDKVLLSREGDAP
ncbi:MAG: HlyC/CorC family transporter [Alphaproteobacteria bacterium]|nr:HlyC/CorC family transporter [Alphaproteobacteria bacterium]